MDLRNRGDAFRQQSSELGERERERERREREREREGTKANGFSCLL
jgi:hypothetical protein